MIRHSDRAQRFYQKKKAERNGIVAIKALGNKNLQGIVLYHA